MAEFYCSLTNPCGIRRSDHNPLCFLRMLLRSRAMDDLSRFCCLNSDCPDHGKRGREI